MVENKVCRNVISIHGSDHRGGVTMTATELCRDLKKRMPDRSIVQLAMSAGSGCDYVKDDVYSIDDIRIHLDNHTLSASELRLMCRREKGAHMLGGIRNRIGSRNYFPEMAHYLIESLRTCFDLVICDTGNDPDNGLAIGALQCSGIRLMVLSQCESSIRAYEEKSWIYRRLGMDFDHIAVNKYFARDPYDLSYLSERLGMARESFITLRMAGYSRQAEMDRQTLSEYRNDQYESDLAKLTEILMRDLGYEAAGRGRRRHVWKTGSTLLTE